MTRLKLVAGLSAALISLSLMGGAAEAACSKNITCNKSRVLKKKHAAAGGRGGNVVAMIRAQAPQYGVPTWFALRIAQIESGYNPRATGKAGEIGVFQLKCSTARGLGYRGSCGGLYNAATNVRFGLKHLQLAVRSSGGNLKLAASKHNGGLGRKRLVPHYVARVF